MTATTSSHQDQTGWLQVRYAVPGPWYYKRWLWRRYRADYYGRQKP